MKTTKFFGLLACFFLAAGAAPAVNLSGTTGSCKWALATIDNNNNVTLMISGNGAMENYTDGGKPPWVLYKSAITAVVIGSGVTHIGSYAFYGCDVFTSVNIPSSVVHIGNSAFEKCSSLSAVTFAAPSSVATIGSSVFKACSSLTSVSIPERVTAIGKFAFDACSNLTSINIPSSVTTLGEGAFYSCAKLISIKIPQKVKAIAPSTFYSCYRLISVEIPPSVEIIGKDAFYKCDDLPSITIPSSVNTIEDKAFSGCKNLKSIVNLSQTPQTISNNAFENVSTNSVDMIVPNSAISSYRNAAVWSAFKFGRFTLAGYDLSSPNTLKDKPGIGRVSHLTLTGYIDARDVKFMRDKMPRLKELDLSNVTILPYTGTEGTKPEALSTTYPANTMPEYSFYDGSANGNGKVTLTSIKLPESNLDRIGDCAFQGCANLTFIRITAKEEVGMNSFYACVGLKCVESSSSALKSSVGLFAFAYCTSLKNINLPMGLLRIYPYCFFSCSSLESITIPPSVESMGDFAFSECSSLASVKISSKVTSITTAIFNNCTSLLSIEIPESVEAIQNMAFTNCSSLKSVVIPESVRDIKERGFAGCTALTSITNFGQPPQTISSNVFEGVDKSKCTLTVPVESAEAYGKALVWKDFLKKSISPFTVSFDMGKCSAKSPVSQAIYYGKTAKPPTPSSLYCIGYDGGVDGWYADSIFGIPWNFSSNPVLGNMTLYTKWKLKVYRIDYVLNGGANPSKAPTSYTIESAAITLPTPARTNYVFGGWYDNPSFGGTAQTTIPQGSFVNKTLYARWKKIYRVTFEVNGGASSTSSCNVAEGDAVPRPADPAKPGYVFGGWYSRTNADSALWDFGANRVAQNTTLYARWKKIYRVTFELNGGAPSISSCNVAEGDTAPRPVNPAKIGYVFGGWYSRTNADSALWDFGASRVAQNTTLYAHWKTICRVTFVLNGGAPSIPTCIVAEGDLAPRPNDPVKNSYAFGGWYSRTNADSALWNFAANKVTQDTTLYADWSIRKYKITYALNGGAHAVPPDTTYTVISGTITLPTPVRGGYTFVGWYDAPTAGSQVTIIPKGSTGDTTLYARWKKFFQVAFEQNGGASPMPPYDVAEGDRTPRPADPAKAGYVFVGWYNRINADSVLWSFSANTITQDTTLYARWVEDFIPLYTVTFNSNGGAGVDDRQKVIKDDMVYMPADPNKRGYEFGGWYSRTNADSALWDFDANKVTQDTTLYADWSLREYKITYALNGGAHAVPPDTTYTVTSDTITLPAPVRDGYTFVGWYNAPTAGSQVAVIPKGSTGDTTLYARWKKFYQVAFELNGGVLPISPYDVAEGDLAPRPADPAKTGYAFGGWYSRTNADSVLWDFSAGTITQDTTLYARWIEDITPVYTVTFNSNGGADVNGRQKVIKGDMARRPADPSRRGYAFGGWYSRTNADSALWDFAANKVTQDTMLYAGWTIMEYKISYVLNDGANPVNAPVGYTIESADITLPTPVRNGCTFIGWYDAPAAGSQMTLIPKGSTGNITLYAWWIPVVIRLDHVIINGKVKQVVNNTVSYTMPCGDASPNIVVLLPNGDTLLHKNVGAPFDMDTVITSTALGSLLIRPCTLMLEKPFEFNDIVNVQLGGKLLMVIKNPEYNGGYNIRSVAWYKKIERGEIRIGDNKFYYVSPSGAVITDSVFVNLQVGESRWITSCPYVHTAFAKKHKETKEIVYPNPVAAGGIVYLKKKPRIGKELDNLEEQYATFQLFDVQGRQVNNGKIADLWRGIIMPNIPGVYYLLLEGKTGRNLIRIAVN